MLETILLKKSNRAAVMLVACVVFFLYKFNDISRPYFWDEMAGYMSGVIYMLDHGISILPSAIPANMSYGHPLLLHCIMASIATVFGSSVEVMHTSTMIFTVALAYGTYLLAYTLSKNHVIAMMAFLLCLAQPVVIAQSTQVLLETFLALCFVYAIYFHARERYGLSVLFATMAVMTKETGMVILIAFIVNHALSFLAGDRDRKTTIWLCLIYAIPFIVFAAFLVIQKQTYGWYLNPVNVGKSKLELASMLQKIWDYPVEFTFIDQGRFFYSIILASAIAWYLARKGMLKLPYDRNIMLILVFCAGFTVFSSIADALERYFLSLIPFAVILFATAVWSFGKINRMMPIVLLIAGLACNFLYIDNGKRYEESDMSYRHLVKTSSQAFDYVNSGAFRHDTIGFAFPLMYAPLDPRFGYYKERHFVPDTGFSDRSTYFIYCSPGNLDWNPPDTLRLKSVREFRSGYSRALIYKKITF